MINAAKVLAFTAADLFTQPATIQKAKTELLKKRGPNFKYKCLTGDRKPPLDYEK